MRTVYFDMDGTIAGLYNVEGWLDDLINSRVRPYVEAIPLLDLEALTNELTRIQSLGYKIGIVSWLSKSGSANYNMKVTEAKREWLLKNLPHVVWDEIHIVEYGTPKSTVVRDNEGILFDDELQNRMEWCVAGNGMAFKETKILKILKALI